VTEQYKAGSLEKVIGAIKWDEAGLVPAVVQDDISKDVLMMAYMSKESLKLSVESGETWFWSRSRSELWNKGATSGHKQKIVSMSYDCDGDTLLVRVVQQGPACHTGRYSCFYNDIPVSAAAAPAAEGDAAAPGLLVMSGAEDVEVCTPEGCAIPGAAEPAADRFAILSKLESVIAQRDAERPEGAYTTYLFEKGVDKILKKVGEETAEVIIAAKNKDNDELRYEASDLIFHLMVLLRERKLPFDQLLSELDRRHVKAKK